MTNRENYLSIGRRTGYEKMPVHMELSPNIEAQLREYERTHDLGIVPQVVEIPDLTVEFPAREVYLAYYDRELRPDTEIDFRGVAWEPADGAYHMKKLYHPMEDFDSVEQILAYPLPDYAAGSAQAQQEAVRHAHEQELAAMGWMTTTVWESAWYLRGMENLMVDMLDESPMAEALLDRLTNNSILRAESFARSGADAIFLGDDIGMQKSIMMSEQTYCTWIKPRLARVIAAAKAIKPDILVFYHTCGYVTPLIPHLIDAGIDVLDPVQPECMDFAEIHAQFGDRLSFHGTIGTQSTMPYGTPEDVRREVFRNLEIAGAHGGLYVAPSHVVEPEVPLENLIAYIKACQDFI